MDATDNQLNASEICQFWSTEVLLFANNLRASNDLCDLTLLSGDLTEFSVHSLILSTASPVLKNLCATGNSTLSFPDISDDVWNVLLELIYTGHVGTERSADVNETSFKKAIELLDLNELLKSKLENWLIGKGTAGDNDGQCSQAVQTAENDRQETIATHIDNNSTNSISIEKCEWKNDALPEETEKVLGKSDENEIETSAPLLPEKLNKVETTECIVTRFRSKRKNIAEKEKNELVFNSGKKKMKVEDTVDDNTEGLSEHGLDDSFVNNEAEGYTKTVISKFEEANDEEVNITKDSDDEDDKFKITKTKSGMLRAPEAVIKALRKLERKSKDKSYLTKLKSSKQKKFGVHIKDFYAECVLCGNGCNADVIKCMLCLERINSKDFNEHTLSEHQYYTQKRCWVSCASIFTPVVTGELKNRIIANQISCKEETQDMEDVRIYKCNLCDFHTDTYALSEELVDAIKSHMRMSHKLTYVYPCLFCGDVFRNPGTKREHQHYCGGGGPLNCEVCGVQIDGPKTMWRHMRTVHEQPTGKERKEFNESQILENSKSKANDQEIKTEEFENENHSDIHEDQAVKSLCITCGSNCEREFVSCMLCGCMCEKNDFTEHIIKFHSHCPTNVYQFRCKYVYGKESKFGQFEIDDRVIGRKVTPVTPEMENRKTDTSEQINKNDVHIQCTICSKVLKGTLLFGKHCRFDHDINTVLVCNYCSDAFKSVTMRNKHQLYCAPPENLLKFECKKCSTHFKSKQMLSAHNAEIHDIENFNNEEKLKLHLHEFFQSYSKIRSPAILNGDMLLPDHGKISLNKAQNSVCMKCCQNKHVCTAKQLKCFICSQMVHSGSLDTHVEIEHPYVTGSQCFTCCVYKKTSQVISYIAGFRLDIGCSDMQENIEQESKEISDDLWFTCVFCGLKSESLEEFANHCNSIHDMVELHRCKYCPLIFTTKVSHDEHVFYCRESGVPYCHSCDEYFASPMLYKKHMSTHHSKRSIDKETCIKCPYCDVYEEKDMSRYRNHLTVVHNKEKGIVCKICFLAFHHANIRDEHEIKVHLQKTPSCSDCGQSFETLVKLHRHNIYWHKGGKDKEKVRREQIAVKKCQYCAKEFKLLANLKDHVNRYHLQYKAYKCSYCEKRFYHTFARKKHEFKDHGTGYYECYHCGHRVYSRWDLKKHEERVHGHLKNVLPKRISIGAHKTPVMYQQITDSQGPKVVYDMVEIQEMPVKVDSVETITEESVYIINSNETVQEDLDNMDPHTQTVTISSEQYGQDSPVTVGYQEHTAEVILPTAASKETLYQVEEYGEVYQVFPASDGNSVPEGEKYITEEAEVVIINNG